jgi:hypothetical protein
MSSELWIIFIFGLAFLITRVILAVRVPMPTQDQAAVFRTVLSLSSAGIAAVIPCLMSFRSQAATTTISATGALAVFALVYLFNPASTRSRSPRASNSNAAPPQGADTDSIVQLVHQVFAEVRALSARVQALERRLTESPSLVAPRRLRYRSVPVLVAALGITLTVAVVALKVSIRNPSVFQNESLRAIFALAGAALGAFVPSTIKVSSRGTRVILAAITALAMFVIIYLFSPM